MNDKNLQEHHIKETYRWSVEIPFHRYSTTYICNQ